MTAHHPTVADPAPLRLLVIYEGRSRYGTTKSVRALVRGLDPYVEVTVAAADRATAEWITANRPGSTALELPVVTG